VQIAVHRYQRCARGSGSNVTDDSSFLWELALVLLSALPSPNAPLLGYAQWLIRLAISEGAFWHFRPDPRSPHLFTVKIWIFAKSPICHIDHKSGTVL